MSEFTKSDWLARDQSHLLHPLHHHASHSAGHVWVSGEGALLTDADGKQYLDGLSGLWNVVAGHGRSELAEVAARQMSTLAYCSGYTGSSNPPAIALAERLAELSYPSIKSLWSRVALSSMSGYTRYTCLPSWIWSTSYIISILIPEPVLLTCLF